MLKLAIVSPCFNEEALLESSAERLVSLLDKLVKCGDITADSFVLFVNDGSGDSSWEIIQKLHRRDKRIKGINLGRNAGHQNAIMAGMMTARNWSDAVVTIDADLQDDINVIPQMIAHYNQGCDVVYGVKTSRKAEPLLKRLTAEAFYKFQHTMGVESVFNHADFRFMSRKTLDLLSCYPERNLYLRGLVPQIGLKSAVVDYVIGERAAGKSKYTFSRSMGLALDGITSFSVKPIYCIIYLGLLFIVGGLAVGAYVINALINGTAVPGWASLMLSIWLIGGLILVAIGLVGVYIGKIYNEVKARPLYNIVDILD